MNLLCDIHGFTEYDPITLKCLLCLSEGEDGAKVSGMGVQAGLMEDFS